MILTSLTSLISEQLFEKYCHYRNILLFNTNSISLKNTIVKKKKKFTILSVYQSVSFGVIKLSLIIRSIFRCFSPVDGTE